MPQIVVVSTATSGASVAVDLVGSTAAYQYAKLVGGAAGDTAGIIGTTAAPAAGAVGLVVRPVDGVSVTVVGGSVGVSGTVRVVNSQGSIYFPVAGAIIGADGVPSGAYGEIAAAVTKVTVDNARGLFVRFAESVAVSGIVTVNTVGTVLGTVAVNVVAGGAGGGSVTTTQAAQTGQLIWLAPTQTINATVNTAPTVAGASVTIQQGASVSAVVSGTVSIVPTVLTVNTAATIAGASITIQQGVSVSAVVSGTVSLVGIVPVTTAASVSVTALPVWLNPTQGVNVSTISGTVNVNLAAAGTTIPVNVVAGGSQTTVISGTVAVNILASQTVGTIIAVSGVTAVSVVSTVGTILGTQVVTLATGGSVAALDVGRTNVLFIVTSSSVGISGTTMPFTIYVGLSAAVAGTTSYVVPAGKTLRLLAMNAVVQNSVTTSPANVRIAVLASTALPTWTSAVPVLAIVAVQAASATVGFSGAAVQVADIPAGATVGLAMTIGTSGASIVAAQAIGYLFP